MTDRFFITGTGTDVGKTLISTALAQGLLALGHEVTYWKPVQAGYPTDSDTLRQSVTGSGFCVWPSAHTYALAASPDQAAAAVGQKGVNLKTLSHHLEKVPGRLQLIEGAGGLLVPLNDRGQTWRHWLVRLSNPKPRIFVVAHSGLGTLNHTCLTVEALQRKGLAVAAVVLNGPEHPGNQTSLARALKSIPIHAFPQMEGLTKNPTWLSVCKELAAFILASSRE